MNKLGAGSVLISVALVGGAVVLTREAAPSPSFPATPTDNVHMEDGIQIIEVTAKGTFKPQISSAKAGIPTILRVKTVGTFDCTSAVRIPSMNISKNLPPSGITDIDLGTPAIGTLEGVCTMGMYSFEIAFQAATSSPLG